MKSKGYIYSILGAVLFGSAGLFVKLAYETGLDSVDLLTVQYMIAVILMFGAALIFKKSMLSVTVSNLVHLAVLGIIGNTLMTVFYYLAFESVSVAMVAMMLYTYPLMVFLYSWIFKREKISKKKVFALFLAFFGCILALNIAGIGGVYSTAGIGFGLLSAVFYAFMNVYSEKMLEGVEPLAINAYSTMFSLLTLIVFRFPSFVFNGGFALTGIKYVVILALFCEIIPLTLLYSSIKLIGALKVSIISNLEIPTAMFISLVMLKEKVTSVQICGALLIVLAVYLVKDRNME